MNNLISSQIDLLAKIQQVCKTSKYNAASIAQLSDETRSYSNIQDSLQILLKNGWIYRVFRGRYRLTNKAIDMLSDVTNKDGGDTN